MVKVIVVVVATVVVAVVDILLSRCYAVLVLCSPLRPVSEWVGGWWGSEGRRQLNWCQSQNGDNGEISRTMDGNDI